MHRKVGQEEGKSGTEKTKGKDKENKTRREGMERGKGVTPQTGVGPRLIREVGGQESCSLGKGGKNTAGEGSRPSSPNPQRLSHDECSGLEAIPYPGFALALAPTLALFTRQAVCLT